MCGRFIQCASGAVLAARFQLATPPDLIPRYNIAPSQPIDAVRIAGDGRREGVTLRWGLVPAWTSEPQAAYSTINARAETVAEKPAFRQAFRRRRCLIPADGFYEWRKSTQASSRTASPRPTDSRSPSPGCGSAGNGTAGCWSPARSW